MFHSTGCIPLTVSEMNYTSLSSKIKVNSGYNINVSHHYAGSNVTFNKLNYAV